MSGAARPKGGVATRLLQAAALGVVFLLMLGAGRLAPDLDGSLGTLSAIGFLLLAGTLMSELLETGKVRSVIDRHFELSQVPDALRYLGTTHARGKVVITI